MKPKNVYIIRKHNPEYKEAETVGYFTNIADAALFIEKENEKRQDGMFYTCEKVGKMGGER